MAAFVDTSGFFALLDADDQNHPRARQVWTELLSGGVEVISTNYVLVETFALLQRRLGMASVRAFEVDVVPVLQVEWVDEPCHHAGVVALLTAGRRQLSLVDCVSFATMRRLGLQQAFAFDLDFIEQGFECLP